MTETRDPASPPLRLIGLNISAGSNDLLHDVNVTIPGGKVTVIVGGSGAGKSVLLRALAGLLPSHGNAIRWTGKIEIDPATIGRGSNHVGVVFQQFALFDELSPLANVQIAIDHRRNRREPPTQSAKEWLDELGVPSKTHIAALSSGQKQRLAVARTLAADPEIILYDEPTSGLDSASGRKVAELIRNTQRQHQRTSIVVTHDYETLLPIADAVLLLNSKTKKLEFVPQEEWSEIPNRMQPVALSADISTSPRMTAAALGVSDQFLQVTGSAVAAAVSMPFDALPLFPRIKWGVRFFLHYLRLVGGVSAWIYLILAGLIVGFTTTYFTFRFFPFRLYTQPLLIDELLSAIGFALYRVLVPVLATILIGARCGAAVAADVGVKQYGGQVDALSTFGIRAKAYLLTPILLAFLVAAPVLEWLAFKAASYICLVTFTFTHSEIGPYFWQQHFSRNIDVTNSAFSIGWEWVVVKTIACGVGSGAIGYYRGMAPKHSATDVSHAITSTVLWSTLYVLVVHFVVALLEF